MAPGPDQAAPNVQQALDERLAAGDFSGAVALLEAHLRSEPYNASARLALALLYRRLGKADEAAIQSCLATELAPLDPQARLEAFSNCLQAGDVDTAMGHVSALAEHGLAGFPQPEGLALMARFLVANFNAARAPRFLNIGGGPTFTFPHWKNLDAVATFGQEPFRLGPECRFPVDGGSIEIVYSSHCIEHLDDDTVAHVLTEARRVLKPSGSLLIKIPDFDQALEALPRSDGRFFDDGYWGFSAVSPTWPRRGVEDSLLSRAAMIFCGFWNAERGSADAHFAHQERDSAGGYHGPAALSQDGFRQVLGTGSPHQIAARFRQAVVENEPSYTFNHQNAWGRAEMEALLAGAGFKLISCDAARIAERNSSIPRLREMYDVSAYYLAAPRG